MMQLSNSYRGNAEPGEVNLKDDHPPKIDSLRLLRRLYELAEIGGTSDGGVCRLALTDEDKVARDRLVNWMREDGLDVRVDHIGNIIGTLRGEGSETVILGSHIDTVTTGGKFDGSLGVLAGLEVVAAMRQTRKSLKRSAAVISFTNEEGVRFSSDMTGSSVWTGKSELDAALTVTDAQGTLLKHEIERIGYNGSERPGFLKPVAFLELHIEQGPLLEAEGIDIGVVTGIQGLHWMELTFEGQSDHAGTTPMLLRRDAGAAAIRTALSALELSGKLPNQVCNVGSIRFVPGDINVVPGKAVIQIDLRNPDAQLLMSAEKEVVVSAGNASAMSKVMWTHKTLAHNEPVRFCDPLIELIEKTAGSLGLSTKRMTSGAAHDAQNMAQIAPTAMIFVPSRGGISHSPLEFTTPEQITRGATVLMNAAWSLVD